jgi:hypothetical protein
MDVQRSYIFTASVTARISLLFANFDKRKHRQTFWIFLAGSAAPPHGNTP